MAAANLRWNLPGWPALVGLLNVGLVALLCWELAHWTWVFLAPAPQPAAITRTQPNADQLLAAVRSAHLFGASGQPVSEPDQTATPLDLKLTGVFAAHGRLSAVAIVKVDGQKELPFTRGDKILPDVLLERVASDHVLLRRRGVLERLDLERAPVQGGSAGAGVQITVRREGSGKFAVSGAELAKLMSDPEQLARVGQFKSIPGQGMSIVDTGPGNLIGKLGLSKGDVVRAINGRPVGQVSDLLRGYADQIGHGGAITVEGMRNGQAFEYNYVLK